MRKAMMGNALAAAVLASGGRLVRVDEPVKLDTDIPEREKGKNVFEMVKAPDARLTTPSEPYEGPFDDKLLEFTAMMLNTMYETGTGVGLSAVQIGRNVRICVIDVYANKPLTHRRPQVFINPVIQPLTNKMVGMREGCLSVPGRYGTTLRPPSIRATWLDYHGQRHEEELGGMLAHVLMHEVDHMEGVLFTQRCQP